VENAAREGSSPRLPILHPRHAGMKFPRRISPRCQLRIVFVPYDLQHHVKKSMSPSHLLT
jgi:hypothetical protein